jgi:hypothetical protein
LGIVAVTVVVHPPDRLSSRDANSSRAATVRERSSRAKSRGSDIVRVLP